MTYFPLALPSVTWPLPDNAAGRRSLHGATSDLVIVALLVAAYLYANLFLLPTTPLLLGGDQMYFWMDAERMMFGELPYRDFFQVTPPGTDLLYLRLFQWFGPRIWVTNAFVFTLGMALCWVCFRASRQVMGHAAALLSTLLFLTFIYGRLLNATHHWISVLLILCAARTGMKRISLLRAGMVGALLGVAAFFTQTHAVSALVAFIVLLAWQAWRERQPLQILFQRLAILASAFAVAWVVCDLPIFLPSESSSFGTTK